ncbi:MAG: hypothetical protein QHC78_07985 [Pigmentiphaga sp.]|uniref:hypothetical protein n=1 Tax=Pigmentiphaga sp. TaxID=1977564 RepID=UPI0029B7B379|nr:hypothetical protein [Pigmentiphaga sp.]MDX3905613.1 hypothetical protein [Pigmentiphaga sp.]
MLMLKIVGVLAALFLILVILIAFDEHVQEKFGHRFFTKATFIAIVASCLMIAGGYHWHLSALKSHGDPLNGWVVLGIGAVILIGIAINNVVKTNLAYGIGGSFIQLPLFFAIGYFGMPLLIIWAVLSIIGAMLTPTVRVVN